MMMFKLFDDIIYGYSGFRRIKEIREIETNLYTYGNFNKTKYFNKYFNILILSLCI